MGTFQIKNIYQSNKEDIIKLIVDLYNLRYAKKRKEKDHYELIVGDKVYHNNSFQTTYLQFIKDFNKFLSDETIINSLGKSSAFTLTSVKVKAKEQGYFHKIDNRFYVNTKTSTERKIKHIKTIADHLKLKVDLNKIEKGDN